jgi:lysophospholipase L1-like esterase
VGRPLIARLAIATVAFVALIAAPARADETTSTLLVVGDSITCGMLSRSSTCGRNYRGFGNLREELLARGTFENVIVNAAYSRNVAGVAATKRNGAKTIARFLQDREVDAIIVALGSNDLQHSHRPVFFERSIREVMRLAADRPVAWVNVYRSDRSYYPRRSATFNAVLNRLAGEYPNLTVVDWSSALVANPKWQAFDKLHLEPIGYRARIPYFVNGADSLWALLRPPPTTETPSETTIVGE